ncbi:MAG: hypothetical protein ACFFDF_11665 [Candidatus Odinarchaeota archaeon]
MGKGSTTLGIIALILATGGLGLGSLAWISVSRIDMQIADFSEQSTWYKFNGTSFNSDPIYTYLIFSGLTIQFELGPDESVYVSFTSRAHIEAVVSAWSRIFVYFRVDGILQTDPVAEVGMYDGAFTINYMLHLQTVITDLSVGSHNVTAVIYGESTANYIWKSTLYVQKFSN